MKFCLIKIIFNADTTVNKNVSRVSLNYISLPYGTIMRLNVQVPDVTGSGV